MKIKPEKTYPWVNEFFNRSMTSEQKKIVKQLKECADKMNPVYEEIEKKVTDKTCPRGYGDLGRREILAAFVDTALVYEEKNHMRDTQSIGNIQKKISKKAKDLKDLLELYARKREEGSCLISEANIDPIHLFKKAGQETGSLARRSLFERWVLPVIKEVAPLGGKYTPSLQDVIGVLISEMDSPIIGSRSDVDAVMASRKASIADFARGFADCIEQLKVCDSLPSDFKLTDSNQARAITCITGALAGIEPNSISKSRKLKR